MSFLMIDSPPQAENFWGIWWKLWICPPLVRVGSENKGGVNSQFGRRPKIWGDLGCKTLQKTPFWKAKNTFPHLKMPKIFACGALGHTESITTLYFVVCWLQNTSQVRKTTLKSNNKNRKRCFWKRQKWGLCWSIARRRRNFFRVYGENCELTPPLLG